VVVDERDVDGHKGRRGRGRVSKGPSERDAFV
jgi:hypothetical protein